MHGMLVVLLLVVSVILMGSDLTGCETVQQENQYEKRLGHIMNDGNRVPLQ